MNGFGHPGFAPTPRNRLRNTQDVALSRESDNGWQLTLKSVIGTTTSSNNAFDSVPEHDVFAYCAGPAVILLKVDEAFNVSQRLFRARPSASPINNTSSFYNQNTPPTTPSRSRHGSPLKEGSYGSEEYLASPGGGRAGNWNREATCLSLSKDGKYLAVGETGYTPRVLLFSVAPGLPTDVPLSILNDHSFGVQSIAFSNDCRWLCSVGNSFDGFLLLYTVNTKTGATKLHSSNKCSNVSSIAWMGDSVITVGARFVKVWRVEKAPTVSPSKGILDLATSATAPPGSPSPKTFSGRNCILGSLLDATFTCIASVTDLKAILCTSQGDVCLLDDTDKSQRLEKVAQMDFGIHCASFDEIRRLVWVGGIDQKTKALPLKSLLSPNSLSRTIGDSTKSMLPASCNITAATNLQAIGSVRDRIVTSDSRKNVRITEVEKEREVHCLGADTKNLPAHESAVLGVCELRRSPGIAGPHFLTYSAKGTVLFWLLDGTCYDRLDVPLDQIQGLDVGDRNELKVVVASEMDELLYSGDKSGVLRITDRSGRSHFAIQAHSGDVNGIASAKSNSDQLVASCGRDRVIQLYRRSSNDLELVQTLDDHASTVNDLLFTDNGSSLISISTDRTVLVRKIARVEDENLAFLPVRVITLKATPIACSLVPSDLDNIVLSTTDKWIQKYDIRSGRLVNSFKAQEPSSGDNVLVGSMQVQVVGHGPEERLVLFGASTSDRAIRLHDCNKGTLLAREQSQTAVSAVKLITRHEEGKPATRLLISCGLDGTISIWDIAGPGQSRDNLSRAASPLKQTPSSGHPARKTLSQAEIRKFQESLESEEDVITPIRGPSPTRMRRKTSRYSMADTRRSTLAPITTTNNTPTPAVRKTSDDHSPSPAATRSVKSLRSSRPSLDHRRRSKSAANLNDLDNEAERITKLVQALRERIESSVSDKMKPKTVKNLESELNLALIALSEKTNRLPPNVERVAGDSLDSYMAKMIDERLALRDKSGDTTGTAVEPVPRANGA